MASDAELIIKWQQSISQERAAEGPPLVADLYEACSELYSGILAALRDSPPPDRRMLVSLQRGHGYLVLWADGFGVDEGTLDRSLDKSRRARASTLRLLLSLSRTLTKRLLPVLATTQRDRLSSQASRVANAVDRLSYLMQQDGTHDSDSDTESETSSVDGILDLDDIAQDIQTDIQCLLDLGSRFEEQAVGPVAKETAQVVHPSELFTWNPSKNFIDRIRWRYPLCDEALAERLGTANWARVLRYQEVKALNSQISQTPGVPRKGQASLSNKPPSTAVASTTFHDSGVGTIVPPSTSNTDRHYAETVFSYSGGQGYSVRIPTLPEGASRGVSFTCVGCRKSIALKNKSEWKHHLFSDLRPYMCLDPDCDLSESPFSTKAGWVDHLTLRHAAMQNGEELNCPICRQNITASMVHKTAHLARHLEEIALTILPTNPDSEDGTDDDSGLATSENCSETKPEAYDEPPGVRMPETSPITSSLDSMDRLIFVPLLNRSALKPFQALISEIRERTHLGMVLREAEQLLMDGAQEQAPSPEHYQVFGLELLSVIRSAVPHINESDQIRPHEQPYEDQYFATAERHVRRSARWMKDEVETEAEAEADGRDLRNRGPVGRDNESGRTPHGKVNIDPTETTQHAARYGADSESDQGNVRLKKRFQLTHQQTRFLLAEFAKQPHPDEAHGERLANEIPGISPRQIQIWFQNRRDKIKRLTAEDRDRMMDTKAVPDDFDNVQALHSPYGAVHGLATHMPNQVQDLKEDSGVQSSAKMKMNPSDYTNQWSAAATKASPDSTMPKPAASQSSDQEQKENPGVWPDSVDKDPLYSIGREADAGEFNHHPDSGPEKSSTLELSHTRARKPTPNQARDNAPRMCREPGCNKEFKRLCDLTKHEKTHSRPWKCPVLTCKYHEYGWPTQKELDRHLNEKHVSAPAMFECLFKPCPYKSKRESNCKQHMEKAHGWVYVRTKTNGKRAQSSTLHTVPDKDNRPSTANDNRGINADTRFGYTWDDFILYPPPPSTVPEKDGQTPSISRNRVPNAEISTGPPANDFIIFPASDSSPIG